MNRRDESLAFAPHADAPTMSSLPRADNETGLEMRNESAATPSPQVSILVPTYNESKNIIEFLKSVLASIPKNVIAETIVIDDNSPDGTGRMVDEYVASMKRMANHTVSVIHRKAKLGLGSAVLNGIRRAKGDSILVMDGDFSHPPSVIPRMIDALKRSECDIVVASRYVADGSIHGWSLKRKIISRVATRIAKSSLGIKQHDPMSGFFAFKKSLVRGMQLDGIGFKILLEILVKTKGARVAEIPYAFRDRQLGSSKLGVGTMLEYARSVWKLYRYGRSSGSESRTSVKFFSKAARFYTVGASGLLVNYLFSLLSTGGAGAVWYLYANLIGIVASMSTNFILNKYWTFEERDFFSRRTAVQYCKFITVSSAGAAIQLATVYALVENHSVGYPLALVLAVAAAAFGNFFLNKKWTFGEKFWS